MLLHWSTHPAKVVFGISHRRRRVRPHLLSRGSRGRSIAHFASTCLSWEKAEHFTTNWVEQTTSYPLPALDADLFIPTSQSLAASLVLGIWVRQGGVGVWGCGTTFQPYRDPSDTIREALTVRICRRRKKSSKCNILPILGFSSCLGFRYWTWLGYAFAIDCVLDCGDELKPDFPSTWNTQPASSPGKAPGESKPGARLF